MAHHKATKKSIKTSAKRNLRNRSYKSRIKTAIKNFETADTPEEKAKRLKAAQQILDRAAKKNILKKNAASRKVSQLTRQVNQERSEAPAE